MPSFMLRVLASSNKDRVVLHREQDQKDRPCEQLNLLDVPGASAFELPGILRAGVLILLTGDIGGSAYSKAFIFRCLSV